MSSFKELDLDIINKFHDRAMHSSRISKNIFDEDYEVLVQGWRAPGMKNSKQIFIGDKVSISTILCSMMENLVKNDVLTIDELKLLIEVTEEKIKEEK